MTEKTADGKTKINTQKALEFIFEFLKEQEKEELHEKSLTDIRIEQEKSLMPN